MIRTVLSNIRLHGQGSGQGKGRARGKKKKELVVGFPVFS